MTQNIYDDPAFFAGYSGLPRSIDGLAAAPEWPSLRSQLPAMAGLRVIDLGCGFGWFCRWAREAGAASVLGIDISERMLARAAADTDDPAITYAQGDLERLSLPDSSFDVAYSSLAFHYLEGLDVLLRETHAALVPGGRLVFSVEHPIYTAPAGPGWIANAAGGRSWPVDGYLHEGPRTTNWLAEGVVKQHRTIGTYVRLLQEAGFTVTWIEEWGPTPAQVAAHPEWAEETERPAFLLMAAQR
ncbi:SAM-dependent methyltransferase [bacterium SCGC AG-212-C10]|nr:SAM-dependent methyltransferase [bacterium SCGC AG-212-C10]